MINIEPFLLESWFRQYYFDAQIVLCSSGVAPFTLGELRSLLSISQDDLDRVVLDDSPSYGSPELRKAIAGRWGNGDQEHVLVTHGSSEAIFLVMHALLQAGDRVVILTPCYQSLYSTPKAIRCSIKEWPLRFAQQFVPDIEKAKALITERTRLVIVNFPNNPTGALLSPVQLKALIERVAQVGAYLLWDAAFGELTYETPPLPDPGLQYERTLSLGTLSKAYGLPGLRIGWAIASPEVLARCVHLRDYVTLNLSPLVELVARRAVERSEILLASRLQQARTNLAILDNWIKQHQDVIGWVRPQGGVCAFLRLALVKDSEAFCRQLADDYSVFLLPGTCFGCPDYVRIGFGGPTDDLVEGLSRLSELLDKQTKVR